MEAVIVLSDGIDQKRRLENDNANCQTCRDPRHDADGFEAPNGVGHLGRPSRSPAEIDNDAKGRRMMDG